MIEAMKQALEALESGCRMEAGRLAWIEYDSSLVKQSITSLRQAIAEAEKQEPVAFDVTLTEEESEFLRDTIGVDDVSPIRLTVGDGHSGHGLYVSNADYQEEGSALIVNTHPQPKREPLTGEEIAEFFGVKAVDESFVEFVRAIEAAHGIKGEA